MAKRRIKPSRVLKLLCLTVTSVIAFYFLALWTQPYKHEMQKLERGNDIDVNKMAFLTGPARSFKQSSKQTRRNVIIVSHGRSGSSLMGDIFNHHPTVFYMYEPLQTAERVHRKLVGRNTSYGDLAKQFLTGAFHCKFDDPQILADIEKYYRKPDHPRISQAIASPPLCPFKTTDRRWDPKLCYPMTSETLGSACKDNYDVTTVKVLISRIPENSIKTILDTCNKLTDVDCKVVFLVRDPRAVITSSRNAGFFNDRGVDRGVIAKQGTRIFSYWKCKQTEDNLDFIRKLPVSQRDKIKLQRFEDLAINPLKELTSLYKFAGLPVLESVRTWLDKTTHLSRADCNLRMDGELVTCTKDDARVAVNRWRWNAHPHEIDLIEQYCGGVMRLMGYTPVDRSYELLSNETIPLFSDKFEAKHWFLH